MLSTDLISTNGIVCFTSFIFFSTSGAKISNYFNKRSPTFETLPNTTKRDWQSRNISSLHASIVSLLCVAVLIADNDIFTDVLWGQSWKAEAVISITIGYLVSDIVYLLSASRATTDAYITTWIHHLLTVATYTTVIVHGCFAYIAIFRLMAEFSTPFVNTRWVLDVCHMKHTRLYFINGWLMVATFFFFRILTMPYCYWVVYSLRDSDGLRRLILPLPCYVTTALIVDAMNIFWFGRMMRGLVKYFRINMSRQQEANGLQRKRD